MTRSGEVVFWFVAAILVGWFADPLCGEVTWQSVTPTQCGGCCPPSGFCPLPPSPRSQPQRPLPDGQFTQPAPRYQALPAPPPPATPELVPPAAPTPDTAAAQQQQQELAANQKILLERSDKSLVVLERIEKNTADGCHCQPPDLTPILTAINELKGSWQPTPPPTEAEQHVVIVADHNAPYWQRLATAIADTRKTYSGVQDTTLPPFPIGVHPQAVVYRANVPVRIVKGQYEVEALLTRLARGESI